MTTAYAFRPAQANVLEIHHTGPIAPEPEAWNGGVDNYLCPADFIRELCAECLQFSCCQCGPILRANDVLDACRPAERLRRSARDEEEGHQQRTDDGARYHGTNTPFAPWS